MFEYSTSAGRGEQRASLIHLTGAVLKPTWIIQYTRTYHYTLYYMWTKKSCWPFLGSTLPFSTKKSAQANLIRSLVRGNLKSCISSSPTSARADFSAYRIASATEQPRKRGGSPTPLLALIDPKFGHSASRRRLTLKTWSISISAARVAQDGKKPGVCR